MSAKKADLAADAAEAPAPGLELSDVLEAAKQAALETAMSVVQEAKDAMPSVIEHVKAVLPDLQEQALTAFKDWVRQELEYMQQGHSPETRKELNP